MKIDNCKSKLSKFVCSSCIPLLSIHCDFTYTLTTQLQHAVYLPPGVWAPAR